MDEHMKTDPRKSAAAAVAITLMGATPAVAQQNWEFAGFLYLWGAGITGEAITGQDVDVSFSDILDNLDFGLMGTIEGRNGRWAVFGDAIYLNISDDEDATVGPGIPAEADVDIDGFVLTTGLGYDFIDTTDYRLNAFGGLRYLDMETRVNLDVGGGSQRLSDDFHNWDLIVGLRGQYSISDKWDMVYYGDIGTGDTDFTWQAALAFEYKFATWSLALGYRHLAWDNVNDSKTLTDIEFSGPFVGAKVKF